MNGSCLRSAMVAAALLTAAAPVLAGEKLDCQDEYHKLTEISSMMASPDITPQKIQEAQDLLDEWQPRHAECMDRYERAHGSNARAELDAKLAADLPNTP